MVHWHVEASSTNCCILADDYLGIKGAVSKYAAVGATGLDSTVNHCLTTGTKIARWLLSVNESTANDVNICCRCLPWKHLVRRIWAAVCFCCCHAVMNH